MSIEITSEHHIHHHTCALSRIEEHPLEVDTRLMQGLRVMKWNIDRYNQDLAVWETHYRYHHVRGVNRHLLRLYLFVHPQHAPNRPSALPPRGGNYLGPLVMCHQGGQQSSPNSVSLWFLYCKDRRVPYPFVIHQTLMHFS